MSYDPQSSDKLKAKWILAEEMRQNGFKLIQDQPIEMTLINHTAIPASCSKKRLNELDGKFCITRPDIDNYIKFYADVLNGIAYNDDRQIVRLYSEKLYSKNPRVEITITQLGETMINEHAITITPPTDPSRHEFSPEQLNYLVKKANRLGLQKRQIYRVFTQEDEEGYHVYFETEALSNKAML